MKAQFVTDSKGRRMAVLLPGKVYEKIVDILEDYEDIKACQESRERRESFADRLSQLV